jgi:SAM-dependent methyltransferase
VTWASVDHSPEPERFVDYLDWAARGLAAMKHYIVATHARFDQGSILDLGCGVGHDLALLATAGLAALGLDPSAALLAECRARGVTAPLVRAAGESLPFRDASLAGCRIDRVLHHVVEPAHVIAEVARCVRAGGIVTIFEPDWTSLRVASDVVSGPAAWLSNAASPDAGARAAALLEAVGFEVVDIVSEHSFKTSLPAYDEVLPIRPALERAVQAGRIDAPAAEAWLREQHQRDRDGRFAADYTKILTVAVAPAS